MRCVDFDPARLDPQQRAWWDAWCERAFEATEAIVQKWERNLEITSGDFNRSVWSDLKNWLLENVFHGKCAYCETNLRYARQFGGDVDHYRPKSSVRYLGGSAYAKPKVELPGGRKIDHPGYFWLAYSWKNLVPSCKECNSGDAKSDKLPVLNGHIFLVPCHDDPAGQASGLYPGYCYPATEFLDDREQPQLCRPHLTQARQLEIDAHLRFGLMGVVEGISAAGRETIKTLKLDSPRLQEARYKEQRRAEARYLMHKALALEQAPSREDAAAAGVASLKEWIEGREQYSLAVVHAMREVGYLPNA